MASAVAAAISSLLEVMSPPIDNLIAFQESLPFDAVQADVSVFDPLSIDQTSRPASSRPRAPIEPQGSTLHAHAAAFVPRVQGYKHAQERIRTETHQANRHSMIDERVRNSGTIRPTSNANSTTVLVDIIKSSPTSTPTPPLSPRPFSPCLTAYLSGQTSPASSPRRSITALSLSPASLSPILSRQPLAEALPGGRDSDPTLRTSLSSQRYIEPVHDAADVILTHDDEVEHLFTFPAKPTTVETLEEAPVVDTSVDQGHQAKTTGATSPVLDLTIAPTRPLVSRPPRSPPIPAPQPSAKLISVEPFIDAPSLDVDSSTSHSLILLENTRQSKADKETDGPAIATPILVDLSEPYEGMVKRAGRTLSNAFTMSQRNGAHRHSGLNGEAQLVDVGIPVNRGDRERSDARNLRREMGLATPSPRLGSRITPGPAYNDYSDVHKRYQAISPYRQLLSRPTPRKTIPKRLLNPPSGDPLQSTLMKSWQVMEPSEHQKRHISQLLEELSVMINRRLSDPGSSSIKGRRRFEVDVFGSVSWGGETGKHGDLDLVVLDHAMTSGFQPSEWKVPPGRRPTPNSSGARTPFKNLPAVYRMRALERNLQDIGMTATEAILHANTPIVKFRYPRANLECDINVNDLGGWYNSSLILHYCLISPHLLRPLIHAIKLWSKAFELNDPSGARGPSTLSSYCYTLMAIAYLQHRGALPNLQAKVEAVLPGDPVRQDKDTIWVGWGKEQGIKAMIGFDREPPPGWEPRDKDLTAADALRGFFRFFNAKAKDRDNAGVFDSSKQIVSILQGGIATRVHEKGWAARELAKTRAAMVDEGLEPEEIQRRMAALREEQNAIELRVGKGDHGIQPRSWDERHLVVQDPFLWYKNCAGAMSNDGHSRFVAAIEYTDNLLRDLSTTFVQILDNPKPSVLRPISKPRGFRGGYRGRQGGDSPRRGTPGRSTPRRGGPSFRREDGDVGVNGLSASRGHVDG